MINNLSVTTTVINHLQPWVWLSLYILVKNADFLSANYGYGGGYSTTSYGGQGGADGGGFVAGYGGSQQGSQDTPGGSKV
jgi:hypothetical protein